MAAPDAVDIRLLALVAELGRVAVHDLAARLGMDPREVASRLVALSGGGFPLLVGVECDQKRLRAALAGAGTWPNHAAPGTPPAGHAPLPGPPPQQAHGPHGPYAMPRPPAPTHQGPPHQAPPYQGHPYPGQPYQGPPYQGPPNQGLPNQGTLSQGPPNQGPPSVPFPAAGPPSGPTHVPAHGGPSASGPPSGPTRVAPPVAGPPSGPTPVPAHVGSPAAGPPSGPTHMPAHVAAQAAGSPSGPTHVAAAAPATPVSPASTWGPPQSSAWARGDQPTRPAFTQPPTRATAAATPPGGSSGPYPPPPVGAAAQHGRLGDTLRAEGTAGEHLTIQLVDVVDPADLLFSAAGYRLREGERAVVVHTELTNRGSAPMATLPDLYLVLVAKDGQAVRKAPVTLSSRPPHRIGLPAGETAGGHTVYVLPENTEITAIRWSADPDDDANAVTWLVEP